MANETLLSFDEQRDFEVIPIPRFTPTGDWHEIIEGRGLYGGYTWAKYLTIMATAALIVPEGYEIVRKIRWVRGALLQLIWASYFTLFIV